MRGRVLFLAAACVLHAYVAGAQELTGTLIGTVKDAQGGVVSGAVVRVSSPALIGGPKTQTTNEQARAAALPGSGSGPLRPGRRGPGIHDLSGRTHPPWRWRHDRENAGSQYRGDRAIAGCRGIGLENRGTREWVRDPVWP